MSAAAVERLGRGHTRGAGVGLAGSALALVIAVVAAYLMLRLVGLLPAGALLPSELASGPLLSWTGGLAERERLIGAGVALIVGTAALWSLVAVGGAGSRTRRRSARGFRQVLDTDDRGVVLMSSQGIEAVARTAAESTPGVFGAQVDARPKGSGVTLGVEVEVLEGSDVRRAGLRARDRVVEAVERFVGIEVHGVQVDVEVVSADALGRSTL